MISICAIASKPISYLSPGYPSDGREVRFAESIASARGFIMFAAGLRLIESTSWIRWFSATSRSSSASTDVGVDAATTSATVVTRWSACWGIHGRLASAAVISILLVRHRGR
jgi:hypothetical protein